MRKTVEKNSEVGEGIRLTKGIDEAYDSKRNDQTGGFFKVTTTTTTTTTTTICFHADSQPEEAVRKIISGLLARPWVLRKWKRRLTTQQAYDVVCEAAEADRLVFAFPCAELGSYDLFDRMEVDCVTSPIMIKTMMECGEHLVGTPDHLTRRPALLARIARLSSSI